jgi:hypothetical protein
MCLFVFKLSDIDGGNGGVLIYKIVNFQDDPFLWGLGSKTPLFSDFN